MEVKVAILCVLCCLARSGFFETASGAGHVVKLGLEYDSPLYPTVYHVVDGSLIGLHGVFHDSKTQLEKGDRFTVVLDISSPIYSRQNNWYEFQAIFCFGDAATSCLKSAMNRTRTFRGPYLLKASSVEKPIPFMVPFESFTNIALPNGKSVPEYGLVHPDFSSQNFTYYGASYDTSSGVLTGLSASSSQYVGKLADISFTRKRNRKLFPQPLTERYFVEWAPDGCLPGLNTLMKGWDMKRSKMTTPQWLKFSKFPVNKDEQYLESIDLIGHGPKTYLVPKGVSIESVATMSVPFSHVFKSVKENVKADLQSYGIKYKEESTGTFQASGKYERYSSLYSASKFSSAISGVEVKAFRVRFRNSFNFKGGSSWDDTFKNEFQALLKSRKEDQAMDFYKEYGTHYIREAEMGGRKESLLSVSYCDFQNNEEKKAQFEAKLLIPYKGAHGVSPSFYYGNNLSESDRKTIISGPFTTCRGGDSLNLDVCVNGSKWRPTVLERPYPTTLLLEPFYKLTDNSTMQQWLEEMYKQYLLLDLEKTELTQELQTEAQCGGDVNSLGIKYVGARISVFLAALLVVTWLFHFE